MVHLKCTISKICWCHKDLGLELVSKRLINGTKLGTISPNQQQVFWHLKSPEKVKYQCQFCENDVIGLYPLYFHRFHALFSTFRLCIRAKKSQNCYKPRQHGHILGWLGQNYRDVLKRKIAVEIGSKSYLFRGNWPMDPQPTYPTRVPPPPFGDVESNAHAVTCFIII